MNPLLRRCYRCRVHFFNERLLRYCERCTAALGQGAERSTPATYCDQVHSLVARLLREGRESNEARLQSLKLGE
jgi:hypothetical protein